MKVNKSASSESSRQTHLAMMAGFLGVILCSLPFYMSLVPPMTDVSQHVLVARIIAEYNNPEFRFSDYFSIQWVVAPTALFYVLLVPVQQLVGPFWDARIFLTLWVILTWLSVWHLAKVRGQRDPWLAALVSLPLAFCWYAYKGFLPFLMTLPLFAFTVAVWFDDWKPVAKIASLWLLLLALFGFHIVGAAAAAAVIVIAAFTQVFVVHNGWHHLRLAAIAVLPIPLLLGLYLLGESSPSVSIQHAGVLSNMVSVVKFTCATLDDRAAVLMLLWLCLLGVMLTVRWRDLSPAIPVLLSAAFLVALAVAIPSSLGALWPAGPRLFPFALILLIVSLPWTNLPRLWVVGTCLALLVGLSAFTVRHIVVLDKGLRDYLGTVEVVEPGKSVLPILADFYDESRWVDPYWALISANTVMRGGSNPYVFATPHIKTGASPIRYRRSSDRQFAFLYDPMHVATDYQGVSAAYDYVLLWGISPEITGVLEQEMIRIYERGNATLFARRELMPNQGRSDLESTLNPSTQLRGPDD